jgi:N-acetyltransferase 10
LIVLKELLEEIGGIECSRRWLTAFNMDFTRRFMSLLSFSHFKGLPVNVCFSLIEGTSMEGDVCGREGMMSFEATPFDLKRLESYANGLLDYHMIMDLLPDIARQHFYQSKVSLSPVQSAILLAMGLQRKTVEGVEKELGLPVSQVLAMFSKAIRKMSAMYRNDRIAAIRANTEGKGDGKVVGDENVPGDNGIANTVVDIANTATSIDKTNLPEETETTDGMKKNWRRKQRELVNSLDLAQYAIAADERQWSKELSKKSTNLDRMTVSIASAKANKKDLAKELHRKHVIDPKEAKMRSKGSRQ